MVYGVVCFRLLLSFVGGARRHLGRPVVGTILGLGPEERRALVVLIARHPPREVGAGGSTEIMVLAVSGNIVTA